MAPALCISMEDVRGAARRLEARAHRTPLFRSRTLDALAGRPVVLKAENLQRTGSFKYRGACNAMQSLSDEERCRGVLTYSSGNHAQALALAGREAATPVVAVMPSDAPTAKRTAAAAYGAEIVLYDPATEDRRTVGEALARERGLTLVPPFDFPPVIAGQGTVALELFEDVGALEALLVCVGGGGLIGGCATAAHALCPDCKVVGVEPELADDAARSFRSGRIETVSNPRTIADGARTPSLGHHTFPIVRAHVRDIVTVSDEAILRAMRFCWERLKLVVEPTGALALAGLLEGKAPPGDGPLGVILSGGNVDVARAAELFGSAPP